MTKIEGELLNIQQTNKVTGLNVLVVGATGGTGKATVNSLLKQGHRVTAFSRGVDALANEAKNLIVHKGDVTSEDQISMAMQDQDVVIVTLGINENPIRVRLFGAASTIDNVRSEGTKNVIQAMRKHNVKRLIVQSTFGVGETRGFLGFIDQLFFSLILKPQIRDTEEQENLVRNSGLEWVIAQPVHLTDDNVLSSAFLSDNGQTRLMKVARHSVAQFLSIAANKTDLIGKSVVISG